MTSQGYYLKKSGQLDILIYMLQTTPIMVIITPHERSQLTGSPVSILLKIDVHGVTKYHHLILARLNYNE